MAPGNAPPALQQLAGSPPSDNRACVAGPTFG